MKLTYYSSECEVDFCGHGTIATMYGYLEDPATGSGNRNIVIEEYLKIHRTTEPFALKPV